MTSLTDVHDVHDGPRDPELPGRLLVTERDALVPLLRARPDEDFAVPTVACPGWTVRDVLAHCSAALMRVVESRFEKGVFSPESNDRDIAERAEWSNARVVDELERGMTEAGPVIARAGGVLDMIALGEWVHAGDVREVLGEPRAYAGAALPDALTLLARITARGGTFRCRPTWMTWTSRCGSAPCVPEARPPGTSATPPRSYGCTRGGR